MIAIAHVVARQMSHTLVTILLVLQECDQIKKKLHAIDLSTMNHYAVLDIFLESTFSSASYILSCK